MILTRPAICALLMTCGGLASSSEPSQKFEKNETLQRALILEAVKTHWVSAQLWENDFYDLWSVDVPNYQDFAPPLAQQQEKGPPARRFLFYG